VKVRKNFHPAFVQGSEVYKFIGGGDVTSNSNTYKTISHWSNSRLTLVFEGILVGIISGWLVVLYRYVLEKIESVSGKIYIYLVQHPSLLFVWLLILLVIALIVGFIIKKEPMIKGSGIPQVEGTLLHQLEMSWQKVIIGKFVGGFLSLGAGLSLGREGPSIQLGAAVGEGIGKILKRPKIEKKYLISGGASAGLAAAFNAPLSGVMFTLEEVHKNFSPLVLLTAMSAALTADLISKNFFGMRPILDFQQLSMISSRYYLYLIPLGVIVGVLGATFNFSLLKTQDLYSKLKAPNQWKIFIPFAIAGLLGIFFPEVLGGGNRLIMSLTDNGIGLQVIVALLVLKFLFTMVSYGSGAPGGIFLPMLAIGALFGSLYGNLLTLLFQVDSMYVNNFIVLAMAGYFTAVVRAPITGCILISEMTGSLNHLLSLAIVSGVAYVVADLLRSRPIYEALLIKILKNKGQSKFVGDDAAKVLLEIAVQMGSVFDGRRIKEIEWPTRSLLVSIKRGNEDIIPKGDSLILAGDFLIVLVAEANAARAKKSLLKMANQVVVTS
jgi:H+/Cl- antiporter ClcA